MSNVGVWNIKWLYVKCWGVEYKISQYNISGSQDLFVSRSIKEYVF